MKLPFNEAFLQFIWQYQDFDHQNLRTTGGENIEIIHPGYKNVDGGPDFLHAKVKIDDLLWVGSVEIHLDASGWQLHKHDINAAYNNVILHVVYENNRGDLAVRSDKTKIPVLRLKGLLDSRLIERGIALFENIATIPCSNFLKNIDPLVLHSTLDRALTQRIERKANLVLEMLEANKNDWEETTYTLITQHFGMKINNDPFLRLARSVPLKLLLKCGNDIFKIEAILFGQAGFLLHNFDDEYHQKLKKEYAFLQHKFGLANELQLEDWKHLRLRPHNFPEIRIAQLAALYSKTATLHSQLIQIEDAKLIKSLFHTEVSGYWQAHYGFGKPSKNHAKALGDLALDNLLINVVCILLVSYGLYKTDDRFIERATKILEPIAAENNKIVRQWTEFDVKPKNAYESQALIELFNDFCSNKKCLNCQIGVHILGRK
ncbi:MAG: DUF2851 family protein [Cytophagales bacterium]